MAAALRRVDRRSELELFELGEHAMDVADVLAPESPASCDQLRQLPGGAFGVGPGLWVARMPQPTGRRQHTEVSGAQRRRARHLPVDVLPVIDAVAVSIGRGG